MAKVLRFSLFCAVLLGISCTTVETPELPPPTYNSSSSAGSLTGSSSSMYYYSSSEWWDVSSSSEEMSSSSDVENSEVSSSSVEVSSSSEAELSSSSEIEISSSSEEQSSSSEEQSSSSSEISSSSSESSSSIELSSSSIEASSSSSAKCGYRTEDYDENQYECVRDGEYYKIYLKAALQPKDGAGKEYKAVLIGTQTWLTENLTLNASSGSKCYDNNPANCTKYGRLYDWAMAMKLAPGCNSTECSTQITTPHQGICPNGWHIPSLDEWSALGSYIGSSTGKKLKTSVWNGEDMYGFAALPAGYVDFNSESTSVNVLSVWWSSNEYDNTRSFGSSLRNNSENAMYGDYDKSGFFSVRCLKNE